MGSSWNCLKITKLYTQKWAIIPKPFVKTRLTQLQFRVSQKWVGLEIAKKKKKKTQATHVKRNSNSIQDMAHAYLIPFTFSG